jgi:hypothetical protein
MPAGTRAGGAIPGPSLEPEQIAVEGAMSGDADAEGALEIEPASTASDTKRALIVKTTVSPPRWLRLAA